MQKNIKIDYSQEEILKEIISCREFMTDIPATKNNIMSALTGEYFMSESKELYSKLNELPNPKSLYLRNTLDNHSGYKYSKGHNKYVWIEKVIEKLPYTKKVIDSLPIQKKT